MKSLKLVARGAIWFTCMIGGVVAIFVFREMIVRWVFQHHLWFHLNYAYLYPIGAAYAAIGWTFGLFDKWHSKVKEALGFSAMYFLFNWLFGVTELRPYSFTVALVCAVTFVLIGQEARKHVQKLTQRLR